MNVNIGTAVMRVNQPKVRRDHDEWHDVAIPGFDASDTSPQIVEDEDEYHEPDIVHGEYVEAYYGEQDFWFYQTGKCEAVELFSSNTGLSWRMSRMNISVGQPVDRKHGFNLNRR